MPQDRAAFDLWLARDLRHRFTLNDPVPPELLDLLNDADFEA